MNLLVLWQAVWGVFGVLALEVTLVFLVAVVLHRRTMSVFWRRAIWQGALAGMILLVAIQTTGGAGALNRRFHFRDGGRVTLAPSAIAKTGLPTAAPGSALVSAEQPAAETLTSRQPAPVSNHLSTPGTNAASTALAESWPRTADWLVLLWLAGAAAVFVVHALLRIVICVVQSRSQPVQDALLCDRVRMLARRMGEPRRVRLFQSRRLSSPVACGIFRPAIGLPLRFSDEHPPAHRDVVLLHELGHLRAGDPAWYLLADMAAALLWWHPLVWWSRRRLHAASEAAADETSVLVPDGAGVLAECLVQLGSRLTRRQPAAWMGVAGRDFRSSLAQRVERLLAAQTRTWSPPHPVRTAVARIVGALSLVITLLFCAAWTVPEHSTQGILMKTPFWKRSLAVLALVPVLGAQPDVALALDPPPAVARGGKSQALRAKLETITFSEFHSDSLPLSEVINLLLADVASRDPEKVDINVVFVQNPAPGGPAVDPATGLPVAAGIAGEFDLRSTGIRLMPPLRNVRLIDVLDAIVRVADVPIKYTVEDYAVVFSFDSTRAATTATTTTASTKAVELRTFKLDYASLANSARNILGRNMERGAALIAHQLQHDIFPPFGLRLEGPNAGVFYNEINGTLLVRASAQELAAVESIVEILGSGASRNSRASTPAAGAAASGRQLTVTISAAAPHFRLGDQPLTLEQIQSALSEASKQNPDISVVIVTGERTPFDQVRKIFGACEQANVRVLNLRPSSAANQ